MGTLSLLGLFALLSLAGCYKNDVHNRFLYGENFFVVDSGLAYTENDVPYEVLEDLIKYHGLTGMGIRLQDFVCMKHTKVVENILSKLPFKRQCSFEDGVNRIHRVRHFCYEKQLVGKNITDSTYLKLNRFLLVTKKNLTCTKYMVDYTFGLIAKVQLIKDVANYLWENFDIFSIYNGFLLISYIVYFWVKEYLLSLNIYIILFVIGTTLKFCEVDLGLKFVTYIGLLYLGYSTMDL